MLPDPDVLAVAVDRRVGFHFTHITAVPAAPSSRCHGLRLTYTLPPGLFADPYELEAFHDIYSYQLDVSPNLELPVSAVPPHNTILHINTAPSALQRDAIHVSVPLHARYGRPSTKSGSVYDEIPLPAPEAVWVCSGPDGESEKRHSSPYETIFYTPVGRLQDIDTVELGTIMSFLFATIYLFFVYSKTFRRLHLNDENKLK